MNSAVSSPKFAIAEFLLVIISCIALSLQPELGWLPLIIAFLPWVIRIIWQQNLFQVTVLDILIIAFLITSFIGLFTAYNSDQAFHKFYLIIGSILLFYSLSRQSKENLGIIAIGLGLFGVLTTIIFILTNNWLTFPADFEIVRNFGYWLMTFRPQSDFEAIPNNPLFHANIVAGINAILLPLCAAATWHFQKIGSKTLFVFSLSILAILALGLSITSSRAAWGAVFLGLVVFVALNHVKTKSFFTAHKYIISLIPILIIATGVLAPFFLAENLPNSAFPISDVTSLESRLRLARQTYFLIADFPLTGAGLGSFPGLYSHYMLVIPFFKFSYSHNLYLDVALEQGIFGFAVWFSVIALCASTLGSTIRKHSEDGEFFLYASAIFVSLIIFLLHGIMDDSIYSNVWGMILFLAIPGLLIAQSNKQFETTIYPFHKYAKIGIIGLAVIISLSIFFIRPLLATWNTNIGAIQMAKVELANWPTGEWVSRNQTNNFEKVESYFKKSLSYKPFDLTSHYRLGLISMSRFDFNQAIVHLETAYDISPDHRGIKKNLAYCYTWLGRFEESEILLATLPEAQTELENYTQWWQSQGQSELANKAATMAHILKTDG